MSGHGRRSLLRVEPARLVELAASSESILTAMVHDWNDALDDLAGACGGLGDAKGAMNVSSSYADSLADAGEVVAALAESLGLGIAGLVDAAHDAVSADATVASELARTAHAIKNEGFGPMPGRGGR